MCHTIQAVPPWISGVELSMNLMPPFLLISIFNLLSGVGISTPCENETRCKSEFLKLFS